jgi:hypothetical protein
VWLPKDKIEELLVEKLKDREVRIIIIAKENYHT